MADITLPEEVISDTKDIEEGFTRAQKAIKDCKKSFSSIGKTMQTVGDEMAKVGGTVSTALTQSIAAGAKGAIDAANSYSENINEISDVFGQSKTAVLDWANTADTQFGLSQNQALEMAAVFGNMGTSMGLSNAEAADMSMGLVGLASDLASFQGVGVDEAMTALNGVFTGEAAGLSSLGVEMTEAALQAYAMEKGFGKAYEQMSQGEKAALRNAYVTDMLSGAIGDYAKASDGTAGSMQTFQASLDNLQIALGQQLLPIITPILQKLTQMVENFQNASPGVQRFALVLAGIAAAIGPVLAVFGGVAFFVGKLVSGVGMIADGVAKAGGAVKILGTVFNALTNPIALVIIAIMAIVAVIVYLWNNCEWFRNGIIAIGEAIKAFFAGLPAFFGGLWETIATWVMALWNIISSVGTTLWTNICALVSMAIAWIVSIVAPLVNAFQSAFSMIWGIAQSIFSSIGNFITNVFLGVQAAWNGLTSFVGGVFDGVLWAVRELVSMVKNAVNGIIGGINCAIDLINMIPGVSISAIPYLSHGTDDWAGGFARINEGGRGELVYLPGGAQVIPHDISVQYAKEAARASIQPVELSVRNGGGDVFNFYEKVASPAEHYRAVRRAKREVFA